MLANSIAAFFATWVTLSYSHSFIKRDSQTLVLLSFDGFRHDYIERENMQHFKELQRHGVYATSLQSTFVTKTFPNHFTIVTGLYDESHGIVANYMYDPLYKQYFEPIKSSKDPKWWNATTPIWILNEKQYLKNGRRTRKSATIYWPGSETSYDGYWQFYTEKKYDNSVSFRQRLDKIVDLLLDDNPVNFIACYFEEPDRTSHLFGPNHANTSRALSKIDSLFGYFVEKMKRANLFDKVNIMVVSDHGMLTVVPEKVRTLSRYLAPSTYNLINYGTFLLIQPNAGYEDEIIANLTKIANLKTYRKKDIPEEWHYKHNRRVTDIFALADEGYYISPDENATTHITHNFGDHGYDNKYKSMHGIFLAHGPSFKKNYKTETLLNVDLFSLMCYVLDIEAPSNNGSFVRVQHMLVERTLLSVIRESQTLTIVLLSICAIFVLIVLLACSVSCLRSLKSSARYSRLSQQDVSMSQWEYGDDVTEYSRGAIFE